MNLCQLFKFNFLKIRYPPLHQIVLGPAREPGPLVATLFYRYAGTASHATIWVHEAAEDEDSPSESSELMLVRKLV